MVGIGIADEGGFVDDGEGVFLAEVVGEVSGEGGVGGEDDVGGADLVAEGVALGAVEGDDAAVWGEAVEFVAPVSQEGCGDDDEGWAGLCGWIVGGL